MKIAAESPEAYIAQLPDERKEAVQRLRQTVVDNLPEGFEEAMNYGMIGYVVPHSVYPKGYHCNPKEPVPYISIASQKNHIAFYNSCIYVDDRLLEWYVEEYQKRYKSKPDMGKSCLRFKKPEKIPYDLLAEMVRNVSVSEYLKLYENGLRR